MNFTEGFGKKWIDKILGKVDKDQGVANAGKVLGIGDDGQVVPVAQSGGSGNDIKFGNIIAELKAGNNVEPVAVFIDSTNRVVSKNDNYFTATFDNEAKTITLNILNASQLLANRSSYGNNEQEPAIVNGSPDSYFEIAEIGVQTIQFQTVNPVDSSNVYVYFDFVNKRNQFNSTRITKKTNPSTSLGSYNAITLKNPYLNENMTAEGWTVSCEPFKINGLRPMIIPVTLYGFYRVTGTL